MDLCSLKDVLAHCDILTWPSEAAIHLRVTSEGVLVDVLKNLELCGVYAEELTDSGAQAVEDGAPTTADSILKPGTEFKLNVPRVVVQAVVAKNLADLLSIPSTTWQSPKTYLLVSEGEPTGSFCFISEASLETAPRSVKNYHAALKLWALLKEQADYATETQDLIYFRLRRTEVAPRFGPNELHDAIPESLKKITTFVGGADQREPRSEIFRSVLSEFLRDQPSERAFAYLLAASELFALRLDEGLAIYLADNSPEKLAKQAVAKHFELAEKLEKVISGMEAKSLTIPIAVLFAVKEMRSGQGWATLNVIILISTLLYLVTMLAAYFSQSEMLSLLKMTIQKAKKDLLVQGLSKDNPVLKENFNNLEKRLKNATLASLIMAVLSAGPLIAAIYTAFMAPAPPKTPTDVRIVPTAINVQSPAESPGSTRNPALRRAREL